MRRLPVFAEVALMASKDLMCEQSSGGRDGPTNEIKCSQPQRGETSERRRAAVPSSAARAHEHACDASKDARALGAWPALLVWHACSTNHQPRPQPAASRQPTSNAPFHRSSGPLTFSMADFSSAGGNPISCQGEAAQAQTRFTARTLWSRVWPSPPATGCRSFLRVMCLSARY